MARDLGISKTSLVRIVTEDLGLHAYRVNVQPKLTDAQKKSRAIFCTLCPALR